MSAIQILNIVLVVLCVLGYAVQLYLKTRGDVFATVSELIALAETSGLCGSDKMAQVVDRLHEMIPLPLRKVLSKNVLQKIAQCIFDWMRKYAIAYSEVSSLAQTEEESSAAMKEATAAITAETSAALIADLVGLSLTAMQEKAKEYGIEIDPKASKKEVAQAIIVALLNKA